MSRVILFSQGAFGSFLYEELKQAGIDSLVYTYSVGSTRRKKDKEYLRVGARYINERIYDPEQIKFSSDDIIFCADWTKEFFTHSPPKNPVYIIHPSLLPLYRGYGAVSEQFLRGVVYGGISIILDSEIVDAGDLVYQSKIKIEFNDIPLDYLRKCAVEAVQGIKKVIVGGVTAVEQDHSKAFNVNRRRQKQGLIDFNMNAVYVYNTVRAYSRPFFGATAYLNGKEVTIWNAICEKWSGDFGTAGEFITYTSNGPEVACGEGSIILTEVEYLDSTYSFDSVNRLFDNDL